MFQRLRLIFSCSSYTLPSHNIDAWHICLNPIFETLIPITSILVPDQDACGDVTSESLSSEDPLGQEGTRHTAFHTRIIETQFDRNAPSNHRFPKFAERKADVHKAFRYLAKQGHNDVLTTVIG